MSNKKEVGQHCCTIVIKKGVLCVSWTEKDAIHSIWMNLRNEQKRMQKQTPSNNNNNNKK